MAMHIHSLPYNIQIFTRIIASLSIMVLMSFISTVHGRIIRINSSDNLISDGIDHVDANDDVLVSASTCQHTYGFLPCAENAAGYIFQILVYQGLLIFGEMQLSIGSKVFFKIIEKNFGTSKYVSIIFRFLMGLPAMIMMILSGVFGSKENAQSLVSLGVGIYAGITVFTLTLQWGICLIYGSKKPQSEHSGSQASCWLRVREKLDELNDTRVTLQEETRKVAGVMLLSLIPYIIVQLVDIFKASHTMLLIACMVSTAFFILYFIYQTVDPWMQILSSEYMQYEILKNAFLQHVERRGKLVDDDGSTNVALIKIVFDETDRDGDGSITQSEMEKLFNKIMPEMSDNEIKSFASKSFEKFDSNRDNKINLSEFNDACIELAENPDFISRELSVSDKGFQQFSMMEINKLDINLIMSKILNHAQRKLLAEQKSLINGDGNPDNEGINSLFRLIDSDNNDLISRNELEEKISEVRFRNLNPKTEDVVNKLFFNFKKDGKNVIEKQEFVMAIEKWIKKAIRVAKCSDKTRSVEEFDKIVWKNFVYGLPFWEFLKCVGRIVLGIVILTFLGGPLTTSILQLSYAMSVPSFSISFVIVPLAMNMRTLIEAIFPVSKKNEKTASLTFSEIYSSVAMNNISGLTILLAVVYAKELPWDYSAEVLTILVVGSVIGILGCSRRSYPFWTCVLAIALYPFSLALYCFVELVLHWN